MLLFLQPEERRRENHNLILVILMKSIINLLQQQEVYTQASRRQRQTTTHLPSRYEFSRTQPASHHHQLTKPATKQGPHCRSGGGSSSFSSSLAVIHIIHNIIILHLHSVDHNKMCSVCRNSIVIYSIIIILRIIRTFLSLSPAPGLRFVSGKIIIGIPMMAVDKAPSYGT